MKDGEESHLNAEKHRRNGDLDIGGSDGGICLDCTRTRQKRDDDGLPETEEDDQFDSNNLQNGFMLSYVLFDLEVKLNDAVHGHTDSDTLYDHDPDMCKRWIQRFQTVYSEMLCDDCRDGHGNTNEAVLEHSNPDDIEPGQATSRGAEPAIFSSSAFLKVLHGPNPWLRLDRSEILFLVVQVLSQVGAHQTEEGSDRESLIAISEDFIVDTVLVEDDGEEGDECVYGYHEKDAYYMALLFRARVSYGMQEHETEGDDDCDHTADCGDGKGEFMESVVVTFE